MTRTANPPTPAWQGIPLLATKLRVPPPRRDPVAQPRLLAALDEGLRSRLILISAPAGFGKTTLLSQRLVADGLSNEQTAEQLIIVIGTVKAHVHHIYGKLEVSGRVPAMVRARELGLI